MKDKSTKNNVSEDREKSIGKSNQKSYDVDDGGTSAKKPIPKGTDKWKNQRNNQ